MSRIFWRDLQALPDADGNHCLAFVLADAHQPANARSVVYDHSGRHEWEALYTAIHRRATPPATRPTVRQAVRWIAQLGGFLGRTGDGEPGITTIWCGWSRLADMPDL
jgi:hypothetical protein